MPAQERRAPAWPLCKKLGMHDDLAHTQTLKPSRMCGQVWKSDKTPQPLFQMGGNGEAQDSALQLAGSVGIALVSLPVNQKEKSYLTSGGGVGGGNVRKMYRRL